MNLSKKEYQSLVKLSNDEVFLELLQKRYDECASIACKLSGRPDNENITYSGRALEMMDLIKNIKNSRAILTKMDK